jgi:hypothetical protein
MTPARLSEENLMTTEQPTIYKVPAVNFARLNAEVEKMNRKAARLGTDPVVLTTHGQEVRTLHDALLDSEYFDTSFLCTIEGAAPQVEGFILVAEIRPVEGGENVIREVPGQNCPPQFRTTKMDCDHCQINARRNSIFIVKNEFGEFVRVGSSCLQDYLGGTDPKSLIQRAEYMLRFDELIRDAVDPEWGIKSGEPKHIAVPISRFVLACAVVMRKMGWVSRSAAFGDGGTSDVRPTANIAWDICINTDANIGDLVRDHELQANGDDMTDAENSVAWAEKIDPEKANNTYMHDLGVCCRQAHVTWETAGYVGSVINAWRRSVADAARTDESNSEHLGTVGETSDFTLRIMSVRPLKADFGGQRNLITFNTAAGDVLTWFTGKVPEWATVGSEVEVTAKVKKHDEYNNVKQTVINYVKPK